MTINYKHATSVRFLSTDSKDTLLKISVLSLAAILCKCCIIDITFTQIVVYYIPNKQIIFNSYSIPLFSLFVSSLLCPTGLSPLSMNLIRTSTTEHRFLAEEGFY